MKVYTSYFYQIRFFPPNLVPLSTAVFAPKWFSKNSEVLDIYTDRRGVINGLSIKEFQPDESCRNYCRGKENPVTGCTGDARSCMFLQKYYEQLCKIDKAELMAKFEQLSDLLAECFGLHCKPNFALIVHEAPGNPCSERAAIQRWFAENGIECEEWNKDE